jgi:hypothetical protein
MKEYVLNMLVKKGFIEIYDAQLKFSFNEMSKIRIYELYLLRLEISQEQNDLDAIEFCEHYLSNISKCKGEKIFSFSIEKNGSVVNYLSDEKMEIIWK